LPSFPEKNPSLAWIVRIKETRVLKTFRKAGELLKEVRAKKAKAPKTGGK